MSDGINMVMLMGNLGADPELKKFDGGHTLLQFRIATNESWMNKEKVRQEKVEWHTVKMWGARADHFFKVLQKGTRAWIQGRLETSSYEKDGVKRYRTDIIATDINLIANARTYAEANGVGAGSLPPPPMSRPAPSPAMTSEGIPF